MSLKDIREYIHLAMEGDSTIEERLQLFYRQRQISSGSDGRTAAYYGCAGFQMLVL